MAGLTALTGPPPFTEVGKGPGEESLVPGASVSWQVSLLIQRYHEEVEVHLGPKPLSPHMLSPLFMEVADGARGATRYGISGQARYPQ